MQRNAEITLNHLKSAPIAKLIRGDKACEQELTTLMQQLPKLTNLLELDLLKHELLSSVDPVDINPNERLINLLAATRERIIINKNIKPGVKTKINRYLKVLQLYLINEKAYQNLGVLYENTLKTTKPKSELETYFSRKNRYFNIKKIDAIQSFSLVFVSGVAPNPYGHVLLKLGDVGYIHIYDLYSKPLFIPRRHFGKFLQESGQMLLGIQQVHVPDMDAAKEKLCQLAQNKWLWLMYKNNCEDFAEAVLRAGGASCAQLDPEHIADYYGHTAYPAKRFDVLPLDHFILTTSNDTAKERKKNTHSQYKEKFRSLGKEYGLDAEKAKKYARYRLKEGLDHSSAQYKADPTLKHFLFRHQSTIEAIAKLDSICFLLLAPLLFCFELPNLRNAIKKHSFFANKEAPKNATAHTPKVQTNYKKPALSASDLAEAASLRP